MTSDTTLESKWWYRLLRVILIPLYGLILFVTLWAIYGEYHPHRVFDLGRSTIACDDGKAWPLSATGYVLSLEPGNYLDQDEAAKAKSLCAYGMASAPSDGLSTVHIEYSTNDSPVPSSHDAALWLLRKRVGASGVAITGVPISQMRPNLRESEVWRRYQRWLGSSAPTVRPENYQNRELILEYATLYGYTVKSAFTEEGAWVKTLSYMVLAWLLIHLALVTLRGAVLYVSVGTFLPAKGLRGWLTL